MNIVEHNNYREVVAAEGMYLHRKGGDSYFTRGIMLEGDSLETFEEVSEVPPIELEPEAYNYDEKVNELIRERYSVSQEFSILRQKETKPEEYQQYYDYCESCKREVKAKVNK